MASRSEAHLNLSLAAYIKSAGWMLAEQVLRFAVGIGVGVYVARHLAPSNFGVYSVVIAAVAIGSAIAKLGLDNVIVRELSSAQSRDQQKILGTAFYLKFSAGLLVAVAAAVWGVLSNSGGFEWYVCVGLLSVIFQIADIPILHFQTIAKARLVSVCVAIQLLVSAVLKLYSIQVGAGLEVFVWLLVFDQLILSGLLYIGYSRRHPTAFMRKFDRELSKKLMRGALPLLGSSVATILYMKLDQVLVAVLLSTTEAGIYSAATRLSDAFYVLPTVLASAFFPWIVKGREHSATEYAKRLHKFFVGMIWSSITVALLPMIFAKDIIGLLYGPDYLAAVPIFRLQLMSGAFVAMLIASGRWLTAEGMTSVVFFRAGMTVLFNLSLNMILIPRFGLLGAAITSVLSFAIVGFLIDGVSMTGRRMMKMKVRAIFLLPP